MRLRSASPLAKLRPPDLRHVLHRARLHDLLDNVRGAALWLCGPPGAGKTTLAASYVQHSGQRGIWYRLDVDDNDVGRFFETLGQAVDEVKPRIRRPAFEAEHLTDPGPYARRWFRTVWGALSTPLCLVFDNLEQSPLRCLPSLLACAIEEAPEGLTIVLTCRHVPTDELAHLVLDGRLAVLPAAALEFTPLEVNEYAHCLAIPEAVAASAAERVRGWAAGLRLLSLAAGRASDEVEAHSFFDHFVGLLHDGLAPSTQSLLLNAALLPWADSEVLAELMQIGDAQRELNALCERNLFVERLERTSGIFRLHPLLHQFMIERGLRSIPKPERLAFMRRAALAFARRGHFDASMDLLLDAGDFDAAIEHLLLVLEDKIGSGQLDQLTAWLARLPASEVRARADLQYGWARLCFMREDREALRHYEEAFSAYADQRDRLGQDLCAAGVLEWHYNTDSFVGHQRWCAQLLASASDHVAPTTEVQSLRLLNGRLLARFYEGSFERVAQQATNEVLVKLEGSAHGNEKLSVAITLLGCLERHKRWGDAQLLAGKMESLASGGNVGPRLKILARQQIAADLYRQTGDYDQVRRLALVAQAHAREQGFTVLQFENIALLMFAALYQGESAESLALMAELQSAVDLNDVYHQRFVNQMQAWLALNAGQPVKASEHALAMRAAISRSDMPPHFRATWLQMAIAADFAAGREDAACDELQALWASAEPGSRATLEVNLLMLQAWRHWSASREDAAHNALQAALEIAEPIRYFQMLSALRRQLSILVGFAIDRGITPAFTREIVRRRRLRAPALTALHWPWPLRVHTLGRFELLGDEGPLVFGNKIPKKPLALLKALIAFGGKAVAEHLLTDALWPEYEADAAHDAFNAALHRLRKLLPHEPELLRLQDGLLTLDTGRCWVDAYAFAELADRNLSPPEADAGILVPLDQALALYRGHFLRDDSAESWSVVPRERLRSRFQRAVTVHGESLLAQGEFEKAMAVFRRGLEIDDLDESFFQGLMQCALLLGRPAEGLAAYQRLKRMLLLLMGVPPSAKSDALHHKLRDL